MECARERDKASCDYTYGPCERKHKCCECLQYHRRSDGLPACYFNREFELTYDRPISNFLRMKGKA